MTREIKFRAWCKRYGDREYDQWHKAKSLRDIWGMNYEQRVSLYQSETGNAFAPVEYWEMDYDPHANDEWTGETQPLNPVIGYIVEQGDTLMQYTGLKDKNGVEIYELCELNDRYIVTYKAPNFVLYEIASGDIININEQDTYEITTEYKPISQDPKRCAN